MEDQIVFRTVKRKKPVRSSGTPEQTQDQNAEQGARLIDLAESGDVNSIDTEAATPDMFKVRKRLRGRGGVTFSNSKPTLRMEEESSLAPVAIDESGEKIRAMSDRFVGHTGQPVNDDKHMMEYIDSEMARRRIMKSEYEIKSEADNQLPLVFASESESYSEDECPNTIARSSIRDPATLGKLQEVHLDSSLDTKRQKEPKPHRPRRHKIRLGRDGRPLKPRLRRRRPSEDIARDALVEQILTENRIEHSNEGGAMVTNTAHAGRNEDADERLAAQFRQDFMESQAQRLQQQRQHQRNKAPTKDLGPKGPKLGGSRSQRAAMEKARREKEMKDKPGK